MANVVFEGGRRGRLPLFVFKVGRSQSVVFERKVGGPSVSFSKK